MKTKFMMMLPILAFAIAAPCFSQQAPSAQSASGQSNKIDVIVIGYDIESNQTAKAMLNDMAQAAKDGGAMGKVIMAGRDEADLSKAMTEAVDTAVVKRPVAPTLELRAFLVKPGETVAVVHSGIAVTNAVPWIGFYEADAGDMDYISYTFLNNLTKRVYDVKAPEKEGEYNFRVFLNDKSPPVAISDVVEVSE